MDKADLVELLRALDSLDALKLVRRYRDDLSAFVWERCRTYDPEAPPDQRVAKRMPQVASVARFLQAWMRGNNFDWVKSRRTLTTWSASDCILADALFFPGTHIYVISEVDEKSEEIIERVGYIWHFLDEGHDVRLKPLWTVNEKQGEFEVQSFCGRKWGSLIRALPQRLAAMRGYGGSIVWIDECGVQPRFMRLLQAVGPASRRLVCTGTLEENKKWDERVDPAQLRRFDGPELAEGDVSEVPDREAAL